MIKKKETALRDPSKFHQWSDELLADKECVLAAVQQKGRALEYVSEDLRADRDVVLAAVRENGNALVYASDALCADREVVLTAVRQDGRALQFASEDLRADREVVLTAARNDGWALEFACDELRADREVILTAVQQNGCVLQCVGDDLRADSEIVLAAVRQNRGALLFATKDLHAECVNGIRSGVINDAMAACGGDVNRAHEFFKLWWMLNHGHTLSDVIHELDLMREENPDATLQTLFSDWEFGFGFGGEIWPSKEEFESCEYRKCLETVDVTKGG